MRGQVGNAFDEDVLKIAKRYAEADESRRAVAGMQGDSANKDANEANPLQDLFIRLSEISVLTGRPVPEFKGCTVLWRRDGSHPGMRLTLKAQGRITNLYPGCKFKVPVSGGTLFFSAITPGTGHLAGFDGEDFTANLANTSGNIALTSTLMRAGALFTIIKTPEHDFWEPRFSVAQQPGFLLLGSLAAYPASGMGFVFEAVLKDVVPTDNTTVGVFDCTGFRRIRVLIDGQTGGVNATSFDLVPWIDPIQAATGFYEQGTARISVPDSNVSGQRFRTVTIDLDGGVGYMYLAINNLLAAGRTGLGMVVIGGE